MDIRSQGRADGSRLCDVPKVTHKEVDGISDAARIPGKSNQAAWDLTGCRHAGGSGEASASSVLQPRIYPCMFFSMRRHTLAQEIEREPESDRERERESEHVRERGICTQH